MSAMFNRRLHNMYSHTTSVAERSPAPDLTPVQMLRQKQTEAKDAMVKRHIKEFERLKDRHNEARNADQAYRNGQGIHNTIVEKEEAEHEALRKKNKQQRDDLARSQHLELERAIKKHGDLA